MIMVLSSLAALLLLAAIPYWLVRVSPSGIASFLRFGVPGIAVALLLAAALLTRNFGLVAIALAILGYLYRNWSARRPVSAAGAAKRSRVRSAALEMELDLETGDMNGVVLAGSREGAELNALDEAELAALYAELSADAESRSLMEAYLDRRVPGWRETADADVGAGLGAAPSPGAMTEQEAYEILGLGFGAGKSEIREAHRRLMKRMHPDAGGSAFLAARINEAKAVLLRRHD